MNFLAKGSTQLKTLADVSLYKNGFAYGATQQLFLKFIKNLAIQNDKFALGAAVYAIGYSNKWPGYQKDYSDGANNWDGVDLVSTKFKHQSKRSWNWDEATKDKLKEYQKAVNGGINVEGFKYTKKNFQISGIKIIGNSIFENVTGGRGEKRIGSEFSTSQPIIHKIAHQHKSSFTNKLN